MTHRVAWIAGLAIAAVATVAVGTRVPAAPVVTVYKSPTCGCCTKWVEHLRAAGFTVVTHDTDALDEVKTAFGVPSQLASCHSARVATYVIEGHVPADLIQKMLKERPSIAGLAVAGMPAGSPGMEGGTPVRYDVVAFDARGKTSVYARR